jgi:hypothetical protein
MEFRETGDVGGELFAVKGTFFGYERKDEPRSCEAQMDREKGRNRTE